MQELLRKVLNLEIPIDKFLKWLLNNATDDDFQCSQTEFLSFFINFIHEEAFRLETNEPQITSTPKRANGNISRLSLNSSQDSNFNSSTPTRRHDLSGISPIRHNKTPTERCLGDFITPTKKKTPKGGKNLFETKKRRINPTNLNRSVQSENSFEFVELVVGTSQEQRNLMFEARNKVSPPVFDLPVGSCAVPKPEIAPEVAKVSRQEELDRLVKVYCGLIRANVILNLCSEICFILTLLLAKQVEDDFEVKLSKLELGCSFATVHNSVYFASRVLYEEIWALKVLDRTSLRLLIENKRLRQFEPNITAKLNFLYKMKIERPELEINPGNVWFNVDTDNRENFVSAVSFSAFRKQRDLFYEIVKIWETNHQVTGWNFFIGLGGKIRSLLNLQSDFSSLVHLARLFKANLLSDCGKGTAGRVEDSAVLNSMPNLNSEKLSKLTNRLVKKESPDSINSPPNFAGHEEFYREFLIVASSHAFVRHVKDALIAEILSLNDLACGDADDLVESDVKKTYAVNLKSLRVLAKFLGLLEALPYKTASLHSEQILNAQISIRSQIQPNLNVKIVVTDSIEKGTLILTIPWVTVYLAMLDYVSLRLPCFNEVIEMLFEIYFQTSREDSGEMMVKLCLGWLFELPHFPGGKYFDWLSSGRGIGHLGEKRVSLDRRLVVDQGVLNLCCPYLDEVRKLLSSNSADGATTRHITPLSTTQRQPDKKKLEQELEEAFFNSQPVSMRRTVEFISERIASTCIKQLCTEVVPVGKVEAIEKLAVYLIDLKAAGSMLPPKQLKVLTRSKLADFKSLSLKILQSACDQEVAKIVKSHIPVSVNSLLALDVLQKTKDTCISITVRMCKDKVRQWASSHITTAIFDKEFEFEMQKFYGAECARKVKKKSSFLLPLGGKDIAHDSDSLSGVKILDAIRTSSCCLVEGKCIATPENVTTILIEADRCVTGRCDLNDAMIVAINRTLLDFALLLMVNDVQVLDEVMAKFLDFWKRHVTDENIFRSLLCPRNVVLLGRSSNDQATWGCFGRFLILLLEVGLSKCDELESQYLAMCRNNFNEAILKRISACLEQVGRHFSRTDGADPQFRFLLNFVNM